MTFARSLTFYNIVSQLMDNLKSIFVPYFTYVFDHAIGILKQKRTSADPLWASVLRSLYGCFLYNDGFINEQRFNVVVKPLVDQILILSASNNTDTIVSLVFHR